MLTFKNNALFRSWISKINNTFIVNAEVLDIAMLMYNLLEYSDNYSLTSSILWNSCRDELNVHTNENNYNSETASRSFEYKTNIIGRAPISNNLLDIKVVVPLKYICVIFGDFSQFAFD